MSRYRALYDETGKVYEEVDGVVILDKRPQSNEAGFMFIPDIKPYKSTATGEVIESRSKHRDHLKRHNLVELGNDMPKVKPIPKIGNTKQDLVETCRRLKVKGFH